MKKTLCILAAMSLLLTMASCGGDAGTTSSAGTSSSPASSVASVSSETVSSEIVSIESVVIPEVKETNLIKTEEGLTFVDMNTGKAEGDEGYIPYYSAEVTTEAAFDGNNAVGWQTEENYGDPLTEADAAADPDLYYQSALDTTQWFLKPTYQDKSMWVGVLFEEAVTASLIKIDWESGAAAPTVEDKGYYVQYTEDGTEWKDLEVTAVRDSESLEGHLLDALTFENLEAKGFRVVILKTNSKYAPKVFEMEVHMPDEETEDESNVSE